MVAELVPDPHENRELPPPSAEFMVIAAVMRALSAKDPGFFDEVLGVLEDEQMKSEIIRLRGRRQSKRVRELIAQAVQWGIAVRGVNATRPAVRKTRRWWEWRR